MGVLFLTIYVVFNRETYAYQMAKDNRKMMCCTKCILVIMYSLYIVNTLIFDAVGPLLIAMVKDSSEYTIYDQTLIDFESIKTTIDFLSCMLIVYLLH